MILARLLSATPNSDGEEWDLQFRLHHDVFHTDAYGQDPAPYQKIPESGKRIGPPYPWQPNFGSWPASAALNPYYAAVNLVVDTSVSPTAIDFYGQPPVNQIASGFAPQLPLQATTSNTGGSIPPGTYLIAVGASNAGPVAPHFVKAVVPVGTSTNTITVSGIVWSAASSMTPYIGEHSWRMRECDLTDYTTSSPDAYGNPTSFTITAITPIGSTGLPDGNFSKFLFVARDIIHGGVWGDAVTSVGANSLTFAAGGWATNQWAGYKISLYYRASSSAQTHGDYIVASNNTTTLILTTSHTLQPGDVVVMRAQAAIVTSNTIRDPNFVNSYAPGGLTVNAHVGDLIKITAGTGAGQPPATIQSNTNDQFTIFGSWTIQPDSTSLYIVISAAFRYISPTGPIQNTSGFVSPVPKLGSIKTLNFRFGSLLIEGIAVDANGNESPERFAPIREVWIPPQTIQAASDGYFTITPSGGNATVDLANGLNQRLVLTGSAVTILAPVFTGGTIAAGQTFSLYLDQDATGGRAIPAFTGGVGAFTSNTGSVVQMDPTPSTRTPLVFTFHGSYWSIDSQQTGVAIS